MATEQELKALRDHVAKHGVSSDDLIKRLSNTAKTVASTFGMMRPGGEGIVFHMKESRPSEQMQAGLDELVAAGAVRREPFNSFGGVRYVPLLNMSDFTKWLGRNLSKPGVSFPLWEPIKQDTPTP